MSEHFDFFNAPIQRAAELARTINWPAVFKKFDVIEPYLGISANSNSNSRYQDLSAKLDIIFDLPFLREGAYAKLRNDALLFLCGLGNLQTSIALGHARRLIEAGADVNYCNKKMTSCLVAAIQGQPNDQLTTLLLEAGAVEIEGRPALFECKREETVKLLLSKGFGVPSTPADSLLPKLVSMEASALKALVMDGKALPLPLEAIRASGKTRLHLAASWGGLDKLASELALFKEVDVPCDEQMTALMYACCRTDDDALKHVSLLLEHGASVEARDGLKKTPLMWAVEFTEQPEVIATLLNRKPDLLARDQNGNTALHYCAARKAGLHISHVIAEKLLDAGADVNAVNEYGHTALMLLAQSTPKACGTLLLRGASLEIKDKAGHSVYDYASAASKKMLADFSKQAKDTSSKPKKESFQEPIVIRSQKVNEQMAAAKDLQAALIEALGAWTVERQAPESSDFSQILLAAKLGSEGVKVTMESVYVDDVDRMGSMLSGPFFVSTQYPMVEGGYPVVQLDLRLASALSGRPLGDGLLQLWEVRQADPFEMDLITRVIPREFVSTDLILPFDAGSLRDQSDTALKYTWESDPAKGRVKVFKTFKSVGFQALNVEDLSQQALDSDPETSPPAHILELVERFHALLPAITSDHDLQLFGCFKIVQYDLVQVGKPMLFTIPYGSSGSAEVFYDITHDGKVDFSSVLSLR